jgi:hypothetical protein
MEGKLFNSYSLAVNTDHQTYKIKFVFLPIRVYKKYPGTEIQR